MNNESNNIVWLIKTTFFTSGIIALCFIGILFIMLSSYKNQADISEDIIGTWNCVQFYKNQESFLVPSSQSITVSINDGSIRLLGSKNASIFRGADRSGSYSIDGGSNLIIDMGNEVWTCNCVFTSDGLLRLTVAEAKVVLYLEKGGENG